MNFYKLTNPPYPTDREMARANPAQYDDPVSLPGVVCQACGEQWAGSDRVRVAPETSLLVARIMNEFNLGRYGVPFESFLVLRSTIASRIGLPVDLLRPGATIAPPQGAIRCARINDFLHPFPGMVWVKEEVKKVLEESDCTGFSFEKVQLYWADKKKATEPLPQLWELVVRSRARRSGVPLESSICCLQCGRRSFPRPEHLAIAEEWWDGSDIVNPDDNPNVVIVTEKVKNLLDANGFTNYACNPIVS